MGSCTPMMICEYAFVSVCVSVCTSACFSVCAHMCISVLYMHVSAHLCICVFLCVHKHVSLCVCTCVCVSVCVVHREQALRSRHQSDPLMYLSSCPIQSLWETGPPSLSLSSLVPQRPSLLQVNRAGTFPGSSHSFSHLSR